MTDLWSYRIDLEVPEVDLVGFDVEATDGHIGKVDESGRELGHEYLVVDTGFWIFGKKRIVPARAVKQINVEERTLFLDLTKDQVRDAPDHTPEWRTDDHSRDAVDTYFGPFAW